MEIISLGGVFDSIVAAFFCALISFVLIIIWSKLCKRFQLVRAWTWWLRIRIFSNRFNAIQVNPIKDFNLFYKNVTESIDLVSNILGVSRTNQKSPPSMPLAIATIEFYENVMDMIWLLACKDVDNDVAEEIYTEITKPRQYHTGKNYYPTRENQMRFDKDWRNPLNASFEKQDHNLMTFQEFTTIFTTSLNKNA